MAEPTETTKTTARSRSDGDAKFDLREPARGQSPASDITVIVDRDRFAGIFVVRDSGAGDGDACLAQPARKLLIQTAHGNSSREYHTLLIPMAA